MFDFCVAKTKWGYEAVFSKVCLGKTTPPPDTGLWWCQADIPSYDFSKWSRPRQIMTAEDRGWHTGPWKPSFQYAETMPQRMVVFFDGIYKTAPSGPFPYAFTLGCLETDRPERF